MTILCVDGRPVTVYCFKKKCKTDDISGGSACSRPTTALLPGSTLIFGKGEWKL